MISQKITDFDTEKMLMDSLNVKKPAEWINGRSLRDQHIPGIIMKLIYPAPIKIMNVTKASDVVVWLNNRDYLTSLSSRINEWLRRNKNVHIIYCNDQSALTCAGANFYPVRQNSEAALALGYLNYILNVEQYSVEMLTTDEPSYTAFLESLRYYDIQSVSLLTGLSERKVMALYTVLKNAEQAYHWLAFSSERILQVIEALRAVCLMPAVHLKKQNVSEIPIMYEQVQGKEGEAFYKEREAEHLLLSQEDDKFFMVDRPDVSSMLGKPQRKDKSVSFYNWDLADMFDVDPFPTYTAER